MYRIVAALAVLFLSWTPVSALAQDPNHIDGKTIATSPAQSIRLDRSGPTRISLDLAASTEDGHPLFQIPVPRGDSQIYLVLKGIFAESAPGVGYDVYLDLPPGRAPGGRGDRHYVGSFSFFDTSPGHRREVRLNITRQLKLIADAGQLSSAPTVTVVPGATAKAESQIGSVAIEME
jgi:hypothetical protein